MVRMIQEFRLVIGDAIGVGGNSVAFGTVVLDEGGNIFFQQSPRKCIAQVAVGLIGVGAGNQPLLPQGDLSTQPPSPFLSSTARYRSSTKSASPRRRALSFRRMRCCVCSGAFRECAAGHGREIRTFGNVHAEMFAAPLMMKGGIKGAGEGEVAQVNTWLGPSQLTRPIVSHRTPDCFYRKHTVIGPRVPGTRRLIRNMSSPSQHTFYRKSRGHGTGTDPQERYRP